MTDPEDSPPDDKIPGAASLTPPEIAELETMLRGAEEGETVLEEDVARLEVRAILRDVQDPYKESLLYRTATPEGETLRIVVPMENDELKKQDTIRYNLTHKQREQKLIIERMENLNLPETEIEEAKATLDDIKTKIKDTEMRIAAAKQPAEMLMWAIQKAHIRTRLGTIKQGDEVVQVIEIAPSDFQRFQQLELLPPEILADALPAVPPPLRGLTLPLPHELSYINIPHYYYDLDTPNVGMAQEKNRRDNQEDRVSITPLEKMDAKTAESILARVAGALVEDTEICQSGSTFLGTIVTGDGKAVTAHMGDSLAVYVIYDPVSQEMQFDRLTVDHKPSVDRKPIIGKVDAWEEKGRVWLSNNTWLSMKRSLGDNSYGDTLDREPEIRTHDFSKVLSEGKRVFLLMGTDGMLVAEKKISEENRITIRTHAEGVADPLRFGVELTPTDIARNVVNRALGSQLNHDNITAAVVEMKLGEAKAIGIFDGHGGSSAASVAVDEFHRIMRNLRIHNDAFKDRYTIPPELGLPAAPTREIIWGEPGDLAAPLIFNKRHTAMIEFERYVDALAEHLKPHVEQSAKLYLRTRNVMEGLGWRVPTGMDEAQHARWRDEMNAPGMAEKLPHSYFIELDQLLQDFDFDMSKHLPQAMETILPGDGFPHEERGHIPEKVKIAVMEKVACEANITLQGYER